MMFRSANLKTNHNSANQVTALTANEKLRPLQELLAAEKLVLTSLQRLSSDLSNAADAMVMWAISEGDDLSDILTASRTLLAHFSGAVNHYSSIQKVVRDNMKAVRTRQEFLDDLHQRRRRTAATVESIKKKLARTNHDNKAFGAQIYALNMASEDMRNLNAKIAHEESTIGAFKRRCTRNWLTLKFGGLAECCEKGMIVADNGKRIVFELSESPRQPYLGRSRVASLLSDAQTRILQVVFSGAPSDYKTETTRLSTSRSRPNRFKDLPQIREECTSNGCVLSTGGQSSTDPPVSAPVEHAVSGNGPTTTSTLDCDYQASPSTCKSSSAPPGRRGKTGSRSYFKLKRSRSVPGFKLDSIAEGEEPSAPTIPSGIGDARSCLNLISGCTSLETTPSSSARLIARVKC